MDHLPPASDANIGPGDQANYQYDLTRFDTALASNKLPAVGFVKASAYHDGHVGQSGLLDEQVFLVGLINKIMRSPAQRDTAIVVSYDDADG